MKLCHRCGVEKPTAAFSRCASTKDGLQKKCKACASAVGSAYRAAHPEKMAAKSAADYAANAPAYKRRAAERYASRTDDVKAATAQYQRRNKDKKSAWCRQWAASHPEVARIAFAKRKAAKLRATPRWASEAAIRAVYMGSVRLTKTLGQPFHVDHVVPLISDVVCGLHCEANLQVLHGSENSKKSNRVWPEMPE